MLANLILDDILCFQISSRLVGWTMQLLFIAAEACWFTSFDEKAWMEARMTMNQPPAEMTDSQIHKLTDTLYKSPTYRTKPANGG